MSWRFLILQLVLLLSGGLGHDGAHLGNGLSEYYWGQPDFLVDFLLFFAPCFLFLLLFFLVLRVRWFFRFFDGVSLALAFDQSFVELSDFSQPRSV